MTIKEAIDLVDRLKPNQYEFNTKVDWLSKLDGLVYKEVFQTHAGCKIPLFHGYEYADPDRELLIPYPYDEDVYNYYLQMHIDRENAETAKYNQSATLYNTAYQRFYDYWNRTRKPLPDRAAFRF